MSAAPNFAYDAYGHLAKIGLIYMHSSVWVGAALDVFEKEPPDADDRLRSHPKVMVSPHAAFYSVQSDEEARTRAIMNIIDYARTGRPNDFVVAGSKTWNS